MNPFGKNGGPVNSVPRNTFDLSFQNNITARFGALIPVMCKEVIPADSFNIDITAGLRFMPTAFPLQTRMRCDFHAFYVRNRNLWKDWPDWFGKTKSNLVPPTLSQPKSFFKTGGLADYLGVPSVIYGFGESFTGISAKFSGGFKQYYLDTSRIPLDYAVANGGLGSTPLVPGFVTPSGNDYSPVLQCEYGVTAFNGGDILRFVYRGQYDVSDPPTLLLCNSDDLVLVDIKGSVSVDDSGQDIVYTVDYIVPDGIYRSTYCVLVFPLRTNESIQLALTSMSYSSENYLYLDYPDLPTDIYKDQTPISALPFRAYESIYNSFYRDERNNPFVLDGEKEYNRYTFTTEGGADNSPYQIHYRNWEQDFLTTAVPTPQQGTAPLVGISATGVMTIQDPDSGQNYQVQAKTAGDADTIIGYDVTETLPKAVTRSLVNYASSGISINDFRNVNAYQRWLETNIRRGFKYRDMIKSHFDVDISYQELDMPEFIGGVSIDVTPQTISQTSADTSDNPLGSYAGQLYASGSSKHSINKYFDEHGFVMIVMSVVPVPNYSQLLPKHFLKYSDSLDYYSPEFGHLGLQAISNEEVSPLQCTSSTRSGTFGYQRAWYDYLQSVDEVHGQFRTTLRNFVMNRVFQNLPVLGPSFTVVDPAQLNDVFTVSEVEGEPVDVILGQVYFDIKAKRPIPRFGVPRLE
ncbi:MAG: hypothetical protein NC212_09490 [Staphylococcus sp.]|nr:hypothetical protein [Staphylococcus sp.]